MVEEIFRLTPISCRDLGRSPGLGTGHLVQRIRACGYRHRSRACHPLRKPIRFVVNAGWDAISALI